MGTEYRRGRPFYYRKHWRDGRCVSEYVGAGPTFALLGQFDAAQRQQAAAERAAWKAERQRMEAEDRAVAELFDRVQLLADAAMVAAGYHRHNRQWRRRRG